jgi:hypothetical protein
MYSSLLVYIMENFNNLLFFIFRIFIDPYDFFAKIRDEKITGHSK